MLHPAQRGTHTKIYKIRRVIPPSGGVEGEIVVVYLDPLTTQNLKSSGFPDVLGRSSKSEAQRVNNMATSTPSFEFTNGDIQEFVILY